MAIEKIFSSTVGAINGGGVTINFPRASIMSDDVILVFGGKPGRAAGGIGPLLQNYTTITTTSTVAAGPNFGVWWKIMGDVPDQSVLLRGSGNASDGTAYGLYAFRGVSSVVTDVSTQSVKGNSTNPVAPSIITSTNNTWVVALAGSQVAASAVTSILGYSSVIQAMGDDTLDITVAGNLFPASVAGTIAAGNFNNWAAASWISATVALRPSQGNIRFIEPGGDAMGQTDDFPLYSSKAGNPSVLSDIVHGNHNSSTKFFPNSTNYLTTSNYIYNIGARVSFYIYISTLPSATSEIAEISSSASATTAYLQLTSAGVLQLWGSAQMGSNGSTLSTGTWYRISIAYNIKTTTVNEFRVFVDGVQDITSSNQAILNAIPRRFIIGNIDGNANLNFRFSDLYIDDSFSLTDMGDVWVTSKRPISNGSSNTFITQLGSGGSGIGTGHTPQINERPISSVNGWSVSSGVGLATELYNVQDSSSGDINISNNPILGYAGWLYGAGSATPGDQDHKLIVNGKYVQIGTLSYHYQAFTGNTYPSNTNNDIGIQIGSFSTPSVAAVLEAGIIVAYKNEQLPSVLSISSRNLTLLGIGT